MMICVDDGFSVIFLLVLMKENIRMENERKVMIIQMKRYFCDFIDIFDNYEQKGHGMNLFCDKDCQRGHEKWKSL